MKSTNSKGGSLLVCSIPLSAIRNAIPHYLRTWIDMIVDFPMHTFVVNPEDSPFDEKNTEGYWYCAGDFCDIEAGGVHQFLCDADIDRAECLVSSNIKDDHKDRPELVIKGDYGVHYVCHNIVNRILYATKDKITLFDTGIKSTGYEFVVKSCLGVYGQNALDWNDRKAKCSDSLEGDFCVLGDDSIRGPESYQINYTIKSSEINKIHLRACGGKESVAENLSEALNDIDRDFSNRTSMLGLDLSRDQISLEDFQISMYQECLTLYQKTINIVGINVARKIYPDCFKNYVQDSGSIPMSA